MDIIEQYYFIPPSEEHLTVTTQILEVLRFVQNVTLLLLLQLAY